MEELDSVKRWQGNTELLKNYLFRVRRMWDSTKKVDYSWEVGSIIYEEIEEGEENEIINRQNKVRF